MSKTRRVIVCVHGIGEQKAGFSDGLFKKIKIVPPNDWYEVSWQPVLSKPTTAIERTNMFFGHMLGKFLRKSFISIISDAIFYLGDAYGPKIREEFFTILDDILNSTPSDCNVEVIFIAHSLGTVILYDCLSEIKNGKQDKKYDRIKILKCITFGSPIAIFVKARNGFAALPENFDSILPWLNIIGEYDPIAYRLKNNGHYQEEFINTFPKMHTGYWKKRILKKAILDAYSYQPKD